MKRDKNIKNSRAVKIQTHNGGSEDYLMIEFSQERADNFDKESSRE